MPYYPNTRAKYSEYIGNLGLAGFLRYWFKRRLQRRLRRVFTLRSPHAVFPLNCRPLTSDLAVFKQIFAQREYACIDSITTAGPGLILDCGANAGFSTAYLLTRFPDCTVIAVEPDPTNYQALLKNVEGYGPRVRCIEAAVWSHETRLCLSNSAGDGLEWSRTVNAADEKTDARVTALEIGRILSDSGHQRIRLLKIDIEGAETEVFGANSAVWLPKVDNLVIELHGEKCERAFADAVAPHGFKLRRHMELTIAQRTP